MKINKNDNKYIYVVVGRNIKRIRKAEGTIANIENNSYQTFSLEFIYVLSKKLDVPIIEFFKGID